MTVQTLAGGSIGHGGSLRVDRGKGVALRAVQTVGPRRLQIVDTVSPRVGTESLVRLERAGICGTDLKILDGSTPVDYPRVLGHELVGTVTAAASGGKIAAGARVLVNPGIHCGSCHLCHKDLAHLCGRGGLLGRDFDGVFAEEVVLEEGNLHLVPDQVRPDDAGLLQVLGTVIHAQQTVDVFSDTVAVVIGLGVSGLLHVQVLRERGAGIVVGVTRSAWKLELAKWPLRMRPWRSWKASPTAAAPTWSSSRWERNPQWSTLSSFADRPVT
ncbi:MAG: alcohol dehydrogenase catalytic domain-containing protein [Actinomycetia bacterium]|nr:alcohol dehydrogenase catalytic domain-containing protein [Actinomycetes bacterium]